MSTIYYVAATLDGFIATEDDDLQWLFAFNDPETAESYRQLIDGTGAVIMGAGTWRWLLAQDGDDWDLPALPTWVLSTDAALPRHERVAMTVTDAPLPSVHAEAVAAAAGKDVWLMGGGVLAAGMLEAGLVDELLVSVAPVVLGRGRALLPITGAPRSLELVESRALGSGMLELRYRVVPLDAPR